jgi:error-prone DNA polymerase
MSIAERLGADYHGTGLTIGRHPMHFRRDEMDAMGVTRAAELPALRNGRKVKVAGAVIVRQRPGTAKGIVFVSLEDETGIFKAVVLPELFEQSRMTILSEPYLMIEGKVQNVDGVIHILAQTITRIEPVAPVAASHDFH